MLKRWLQLFAASPAYNTSTPAAGSDPNHIAEFASPNTSRWADAAATFKTFITNWGNGNPYSLFSDIPSLWYEGTKYNSEVIFDRQAVSNIIGSTFEQYGGPVYVLGAYYTWAIMTPRKNWLTSFIWQTGCR